MKVLRKYASLPPADKILVGEVFLCVVTVRVLLSLIPFRHILSLSRRWGSPLCGQARETNSAAEKALSRWVVATARRVPAASCLTQALALQFLLARRGWRSELHIGVSKADGHFRAHAWLETCHGVVIGGGRHLGSYQPILSSSPCG